MAPRFATCSKRTAWCWRSPPTATATPGTSCEPPMAPNRAECPACASATRARSAAAARWRVCRTTSTACASWPRGSRARPGSSWKTSPPHGPRPRSSRSCATCSTWWRNRDASAGGRPGPWTGWRRADRSRSSLPARMDCRNSAGVDWPAASRYRWRPLLRLPMPVAAETRPCQERMPSHMEIEAKFDVPDDSTLERLLSLETLGDYALVAGSEQRTSDRYLDTPGRDLLRAGRALRRRIARESGSELITVKGRGGIRGAVHHRDEHELEVLSGAPPEQWPPGPAQDLVLSLAAGQPLVELLAFQQHRATRDVMRDGERVAVLSLDRIEFAPGVTERELEIELLPAGGPADLDALEALLHPSGLELQPRSKFERARALLDAGAAELVKRGEARERLAEATRVPERRAPRAPARRRKHKGKPVGLRTDDPMAEAGRKILRFHWEQALAHEPGTLAGEDPEELHDMRVATRRQRSALRIVQPHLRRKAERLVRNGLRALGGCLGAVRDLDVLLAAARAHQATLAPAEAAAFQKLLDVWLARRDAARHRMLEYLGGPEHAQFKHRYADFLATPGAGARAETAHHPTLVAHVLPTELWSHYGALCAFDRALPGAPAEMLHEMRIEGKRLRYLLEFFREVLDRCVEKPIKTIVALQDHLGELQDCVVTIGLVDEFLAGPEAVADPVAAAAAGRYREVRRARIEELKRTLERPWQAVTDSGFRSCLSRASARLHSGPARKRLPGATFEAASA